MFVGLITLDYRYLDNVLNVGRRIDLSKLDYDSTIRHEVTLP